MNPRELLLFAVAGWTALGVLGVTLSWARRERANAKRGMAWIAGIWALYLGALLTVSLTQPRHVVSPGQQQCFGDMCFTVTGVEQLPGFLIRDGSRLVRVTVRVSNRASRGVQAESLMRAYLIDAEGRLWQQSPGISGVPLTAQVGAGDSIVSEPIFKVARDATGLGLVLTRGRGLPQMLVIGDPDSWLHRPTVVSLGSR